MELYLICLVTLVFIVLPTTLAAEHDGKKPINTRTHRLVMHIKPNGSKWDILGYNCNRQQCVQYRGGDVGTNGKGKREFNCNCVQPLPFILPVNCILSETVECKEICLGSICKEICQKIVTKKCQVVNG